VGLTVGFFGSTRSSLDHLFIIVDALSDNLGKRIDIRESRQLEGLDGLFRLVPPLMLSRQIMAGGVLATDDPGLWTVAMNDAVACRTDDDTDSRCST